VPVTVCKLKKLIIHPLAKIVWPTFNHVCGASPAWSISTQSSLRAFWILVSLWLLIGWLLMSLMKLMVTFSPLAAQVFLHSPGWLKLVVVSFFTVVQSLFVQNLILGKSSWEYEALSPRVGGCGESSGVLALMNVRPSVLWEDFYSKFSILSYLITGYLI